MPLWTDDWTVGIGRIVYTDSQALSIMTILLFAVVTDYSLLIFSRYREELRIYESVNEAMSETMRHVKEPIFFSGSTIVLGVATLFFTLYEPYRNFAPVFAIAAVAMLIAGLHSSSTICLNWSESILASHSKVW